MLSPAECGKCCTGRGEVHITTQEAVRIAGHLNLSTNAFLRAYAQPYSPRHGWHMLVYARGSMASHFSAYTHIALL